MEKCRFQKKNLKSKIKFQKHAFKLTNILNNKINI